MDNSFWFAAGAVYGLLIIPACDLCMVIAKIAANAWVASKKSKGDKPGRKGS